MAEKLKTTIIQDRNGLIKKVRIGETTVDVITAGPIVIAGGIALALTVPNVEIEVEQEAPAAEGA
jgi:hypothetical protein